MREDVTHRVKVYHRLATNSQPVLYSITVCCTHLLSCFSLQVAELGSKALCCKVAMFQTIATGAHEAHHVFLQGK